MAAEIRVRSARPDERVAVLRVLDAAMLATDATALAERIEAGRVLVAVVDGMRNERVVGAIEVSEGRGEQAGNDDESTAVGGHIEAVAVTRRRRGQGIGSALVAAAGERWRPLIAAFEAAVEPFYEKLGFEIEETSGGRFRGRLH